MDYVSIGWVWLERTLNNIIREVNSQKAIQSSTIAIEESPNGTLFKVIPIQAPGNQSSQTGGGTQEQHILATRIIWAGVKWQDVTVVNPSTCAPSTLSVLVYTGNDSDFIAIPNITHPFWAEP